MTAPTSTPTRVFRTAVLLAADLMLGVVVARSSFMPGARHTSITQSVVVERLSVAKLVTTEALVRDVVTYRQTWLGSTKRALVIITGKALVGVDLRVPPRIILRERDKHITLVFSHARLLGVDITDLKTYDESRGLWESVPPRRPRLDLPDCPRAAGRVGA